MTKAFAGTRIIKSFFPCWSGQRASEKKKNEAHKFSTVQTAYRSIGKANDVPTIS